MEFSEFGKAKLQVPDGVREKLGIKEKQGSIPEKPNDAPRSPV